MSTRIEPKMPVTTTNSHDKTNVNQYKSKEVAIDLTKSSASPDDMTGLVLEKNPNNFQVKAGYYSKDGNNTLELGADYSRTINNTSKVTTGASIYTGGLYQVRTGYEFNKLYNDKLSFSAGANFDVSWGNNNSNSTGTGGITSHDIYPAKADNMRGAGKVFLGEDVRDNIYMNNTNEPGIADSTYRRGPISALNNTYSTWIDNVAVPETANTWNQAGLSLRAGVNYNVNDFTFSGGMSSRTSVQFDDGKVDNRLGIYGGAEYNLGDAIKDKVNNSKIADGLTAGFRFDTASKEFGVSVKKYF